MCRNCGAAQDDMYLYSEPDEPFFDIPGAPPASIELKPVRKARSSVVFLSARVASHRRGVDKYALVAAGLFEHFGGTFVGQTLVDDSTHRLLDISRF
jgi:hypothetical protein